MKNLNFLTAILTLEYLNDDKNKGKYILDFDREKTENTPIKPNKLLKSDKEKTEQKADIMG